MDALENLVKIRQLNKELPDPAEIQGLVERARVRIQDARLTALSCDSQFFLAYGAAHSLALAALRWHGYRSDKRYLVFQCLKQTLGMSDAKWRVLDECHRRRNLAEYEGHIDIEEQLLRELRLIVTEMLEKVEELVSTVG